jgi:hypothetical protein
MRSSLRALSIKQPNLKQWVNVLFESSLNIFQEVLNFNPSLYGKCTATGPKVMLYAAGGTKALQKVML